MACSVAAGKWIAEIRERRRRLRRVGRQAADVAREQRNHIVHLERADHEEREVGRVARSAPCRTPASWPRSSVPTRSTVNGRDVKWSDVLTAVSLSPKTAIGLSSRLATAAVSCRFSSVEGLGIVAGLRELRIEQLQRGLELRRRGRAGDAVRRERDERRRVRELAGELLLQVDAP